MLGNPKAIAHVTVIPSVLNNKVPLEAFCALKIFFRVSLNSLLYVSSYSMQVVNHKLVTLQK